MDENLHSEEHSRRPEAQHGASNPDYAEHHQNEPEVNDAAASDAPRDGVPARPDAPAPGEDPATEAGSSDDATPEEIRAALESDHGVWTPFDLPLNRARERQRARHERDAGRHAAPRHGAERAAEEEAPEYRNPRAEDHTPTPQQPAPASPAREDTAEFEAPEPFEAELQDSASDANIPDPHAPVRLDDEPSATEETDYEFPAAPLNDYMDDPLARAEAAAEEAYDADEARAEAEEEEARVAAENRAREEAEERLKAKARKETDEVDLLAPLRTESTGDAEPWSPESGPVDEAFEKDERLRQETEARKEAERARQKAEKAQRVQERAQEKAQAKQTEARAESGEAPAHGPSDQERLRRRLDKYPEIRGPVRPRFHLNLNKASHRYGTIAVSLLLVVIVVLSSVFVGQKQRQQANRQLEIEKDLLSFSLSSGQVPSEQTLKHSDPKRIVNATLPLFNDAQIDQWCQVWARERIDDFELRTNPLPSLLPEQRPILNVGHRSEIVSDGLLSVELISEVYASTKALKDGVLDQSERASFLYDLRYRVFLEPSDIFRDGAYEQLAQIGNAKLSAGNFKPLTALASDAYDEYLTQKNGEDESPQADEAPSAEGAAEEPAAAEGQPAEGENPAPDAPEAQAEATEQAKLWSSTLLAEDAEEEEAADPDNPYASVKLPASSILYKHLRFVPEGVEITLDPALVPQGSSNLAITYSYDEILDFLLFEQQADGQFRFNYRVDPLGDTQRNYEARLLNALYGTSVADASGQAQGLPETKVLTEEPQPQAEGENPEAAEEDSAAEGDALSGNIFAPHFLRAEAHVADPGPEDSPHDATPIDIPADEGADADAIPREHVAEDDAKGDATVQDQEADDANKSDGEATPEAAPGTPADDTAADNAPSEEATTPEAAKDKPQVQPQLSEQLNQAAPYPPGGLTLADHFVTNKAGYSQEIRYIALTFNGSPSSQTTQRMLDLLSAYRGKGTFFVRGKTAEIETAPPLLQDIIKQGSQIGNHAYNDYAFTLLNDNDIGLEVGDTADFLEQLTGVRPTVVRPPLASYDDRVIAAVGQPLITWSFALGDADGATVADMQETMDRYLEPGSIVLCTEGIDETLDFFEEALPDLYAKGYRFVTIDELFAIYTNDGLQPGKVYNSVWS